MAGEIISIDAARERSASRVLTRTRGLRPVAVEGESSRYARKRERRRRELEEWPEPFSRAVDLDNDSQMRRIAIWRATTCEGCAAKIGANVRDLRAAARELRAARERGLRRPAIRRRRDRLNLMKHELLWHLFASGERDVRELHRRAARCSLAAHTRAAEEEW